MRDKTERCAEKGEVEKVGMQWPEKPASANDFIGHWSRTFRIILSLFRLKAVCHPSDWVIMTIQRIGNLNDFQSSEFL